MALIRDTWQRRWAIGVAGLITVAAWAITVRSSAQMAGTMPMPGGWSMSMPWMGMAGQTQLERASMFLAMWAVMMIAMMLPSVMPTVLLHRRLIQARRARGEPGGGSDLLLLVGYFTIWTGFGAVAYAVGLFLVQAAMRSTAISAMVPVAIGLTLAGAGLYQVTHWKRACLRHCRSPLEFFSQRRIRSASDSLQFGFHHGAYCAACCWGLMAIQLVLGVMSLPLMAAVAILIFLEKQWRHGETLAVIIGILAVVWGAVTVLLSAL